MTNFTYLENKSDNCCDKSKLKQESFLEEGRCPSCGTQCYKIVRRSKKALFPFWGHNKKFSVSDVVRKPLTIKGKVQKGICLQCILEITPPLSVIAKPPYKKDAATSVSKEFPDDERISKIVKPKEEIDTDITETETETESSASNSNTNEIISFRNKPTSSLEHLKSSKRTSQKKGKTVYIGEYNEYGNPNGKGEMVWSNGDRYVGDFFNGQRHGQGALYFQDGSEYVGEWECNRMHGHGTRRYTNGDVYVGNYVDNKRSGIGRFDFANGDTFYGKWFNDRTHGYGRFYYVCSGISFEGGFQNGKRHGLGKLRRQNGEVEIYFYDSNCHGQRTFPGIRWSKDQSRAWKIVQMNCRTTFHSISIEEADTLYHVLEARKGESGTDDLEDITQLKECEQFFLSCYPNADATDIAVPDNFYSSEGTMPLYD